MTLAPLKITPRCDWSGPRGSVLFEAALGMGALAMAIVLYVEVIRGSLFHAIFHHALFCHTRMAVLSESPFVAKQEGLKALGALLTHGELARASRFAEFKVKTRADGRTVGSVRYHYPPLFFGFRQWPMTVAKRCPF